MPVKSTELTLIPCCRTCLDEWFDISIVFVCFTVCSQYCHKVEKRGSKLFHVYLFFSQFSAINASRTVACGLAIYISKICTYRCAITFKSFPSYCGNSISIQKGSSAIEINYTFAFLQSEFFTCFLPIDFSVFQLKCSSSASEHATAYCYRTHQ